MVRAAGHRPCSVPLSGMPLGIIVVVVSVRCCRHRRTVRCCYRTVRCCYRTAPAVVIACHRRCCHASSSFSLCCHLAAPRAIVHRRCTVVPLSCCWIRCRCLPPLSLLRRCHLPPLSLLHHLCRCAVGRCRCGAIGRHHCTVFASPGPPLLPLGIAMPCTCHQW